MCLGEAAGNSPASPKHCHLTVDVPQSINSDYNKGIVGGLIPGRVKRGNKLQVWVDSAGPNQPGEADSAGPNQLMAESTIHIRFKERSMLKLKADTRYARQREDTALADTRACLAEVPLSRLGQDM